MRVTTRAKESKTVIFFAFEHSYILVHATPCLGEGTEGQVIAACSYRPVGTSCVGAPLSHPLLSIFFGRTRHLSRVFVCIAPGTSGHGRHRQQHGAWCVDLLLHVYKPTRALALDVPCVLFPLLFFVCLLLSLPSLFTMCRFLRTRHPALQPTTPTNKTIQTSSNAHRLAQWCVVPADFQSLHTHGGLF